MNNFLTNTIEYPKEIHEHATTFSLLTYTILLLFLLFACIIFIRTRPVAKDSTFQFKYFYE